MSYENIESAKQGSFLKPAFLGCLLSKIQNWLIHALRYTNHWSASDFLPVTIFLHTYLLDSTIFQNLVDLAGSEKAGENSGNRFREGCSINLSLLTLSQVIRKLSEGDK